MEANQCERGRDSYSSECRTLQVDGDWADCRFSTIGAYIWGTLAVEQAPSPDGRVAAQEQPPANGWCAAVKAY